MPDQSKPSLTDTVRSLKSGPATISPEQARQHLENLLYMTSVLYITDKKNEKHLKRITEIMTAMEQNFAQEINKEAGGEVQSEGDVYLVARLEVINKILDRGINQVKRIIEAPVSPSKPSVTGGAVPIEKSAAIPILPSGERPKLRETLSFLLSVIGDPVLGEKQVPLHLLNLEKMSHLIRVRQEDPKLLKLKDSILSVLSKIYGTNNAEQLRLQLNNSIKILKNMPQYNKLLHEFEASVKSFILPPEAKPSVVDTNEAARRLQSLKQDEEFYKVFREEKHLLKRISLVENVLKDGAFRYNKELTAACMRFEGGLRLMGLQ